MAPLVESLKPIKLISANPIICQATGDRKSSSDPDLQQQVVYRISGRSQAGGGAAAAEARLAGGIFGDMPVELLAPDRLPGAAASVQGVGFGKVGVFAPQIAESEPARGHAGVAVLLRFLRHI